MPWSWLVDGRRPQSWIRLRSITTPRGGGFEYQLETEMHIDVWSLVISLPRSTTLSALILGPMSPAPLSFMPWIVEPAPPGSTLISPSRVTASSLYGARVTLGVESSSRETAKVPPRKQPVWPLSSAATRRSAVRSGLER